MVTLKESAAHKAQLELRRGVLLLAVLSQLRTSQYGYSLRQALAEQGMPIEEGTLYPLLRRLEGQAILESEWRIEEGPPRRYYRLSKEGRLLLDMLTEQWRGLVDTLEGLLGRKETKRTQKEKTK
jgi:DNA-binding PadR family transcriptional regulator